MQHQLTLRTIAEIARRFASTQLVGDESKILTRALDAESFPSGVNMIRERFGYEVVRVASEENADGDLVANAIFTMGPKELFHLKTMESKRGSLKISMVAWSIPPVVIRSNGFRGRTPTEDLRQSLVYVETSLDNGAQGQWDQKVSVGKGFTKSRASAAKVVIDSLSVVRKKILASHDARELDLFMHLIRDDAAVNGVKLVAKIPVPEALVVEESEFKALREAAISPFAA